MRICGGIGAADRLATIDEQAKLERVFNYRFGDIYGNYLAKVKRKGHSREELDDVLGWFTGLDATALQQAADSELTLRDYFGTVTLTTDAELITGKVCGVRVEEVDDELIRSIRQMIFLSTSWPAARRSPTLNAPSACRAAPRRQTAWLRACGRERSPRAAPRFPARFPPQAAMRLLRGLGPRGEIQTGGTRYAKLHNACSISPMEKGRRGASLNASATRRCRIRGATRRRGRSNPTAPPLSC